MERLTPKRLKEKSADTIRFIGNRVNGSGWAELGDAYGEAVGGHEQHRPTIIPAPLAEVVQLHPAEVIDLYPWTKYGIERKDPVEHGWHKPPMDAA